MKSCLLATLLLFSCARTPPPQYAGLLFVLGDSITAGEGVGPTESFIQVLAEKYPTWDMRSEGAPGWSASDYLTNVAKVLPDVPANATLVAIQLGSNECRTTEPVETFAPRAAKQLDELAQRIRGRAPGARLLLLAPPPVSPPRLSPRMRQGGFGEGTPERIRRIGAAWEALAKERGYLFIDLAPVVPAEELIDGVHPNTAGHRRIAAALGRVLEAAR